MRVTITKDTGSSDIGCWILVHTMLDTGLSDAGDVDGYNNQPSGKMQLYLSDPACQQQSRHFSLEFYLFSLLFINFASRLISQQHVGSQEYRL